jgi:hypothetical protein
VQQDECRLVGQAQIAADGQSALAFHFVAEHSDGSQIAAQGTYVELAKRLKKHGFAETEVSVTNKLKRGTFSATFFLARLAAMELEGVVLEDI